MGGKVQKLALIILMVVLAVGSFAVIDSRNQEPRRKVSLAKIQEGSRASFAGNWACSGCKSINKPPQQPTSAQGHYQRATLRAAISAMITPRVTISLYEDLFKYVEDKLERRVELAQRRTYREVNDLVRRRLVDFAFVCSLSYALGHDEFGMEILAVPEVDGKSQYYSYIIVRADSKIGDLEGLRGKTFAFMEPDSNTGWLYPTYRLTETGESADTFFSNYVYTYSHDNSIRAVAGQAVDGAAVDSLVFAHMVAADPGLAAQVKIIEKSPAFGIPPVVVHPALDSETKEQLRDILLNLHLDEEGKQALQKLHIDKFVRQDDRAYDSIREMYRSVQGQLGLVLQFPFAHQAAAPVALLGDSLVAPPPTGPLHDPLGRVGGGPDEPDEKPADLRDGDRYMDGASRPPLFAAPTASAAKANRASVI